MLTRLFADNFRCLVNFELRPGKLSLFLGSNGSGKTSVFNALGALTDLVVRGVPCSQLFASTRTKWETRDIQRFELEVQGNGGAYQYLLDVHHPSQPTEAPAIQSEVVNFDGEPLYRFTGGEVHLHQDDHTKGAVFPFRPDRCFLTNVDPPGAKQMSKIIWLKGFLARTRIVQINPFDIDFFSRQDEPVLGRYGKNLASFFGHLNNERPDARTELENLMKDALPGFRNMLFRRLGDTRALYFSFADDERRSVEYALSELSEGQRVLVILYAAISDLLDSEAILCFDEPDNFVSLPEIQPWLQTLRDLLTERGGQAIIISHHPEVIDYLALDSIWRFERPAGPVIARPLELSGTSESKLSEIVARGG